MRLRGMWFSTFAVFLIIVLTGCFQGEQSLEEMDPPDDQEVVDGEDGKENDDETGDTDQEIAEEEDENDAPDEEDEAEEDEAADESTQMVERQLFLLDKDGMVAPQILELPAQEDKEVATQALEYLVRGGPVTSLLPNGFQAVLPEGTEVLGLDLQEDGTMVVDLSEEFTDYDADDELKILQAMTYTLTQFDSVEQIQLMINGEMQEEMPVDGTPIGDGYSRANGINILGIDTIDLVNSQAVTMYYPAVHNDNNYFVPVTQHVEMDDDDRYAAIVETLIEGPGYNSNLLHVFNTHTLLTEKPELKDGVLELMFNDGILKDTEESIVSDEVMETLVRTLTEWDEVDAVQVNVENVEQVMNESGEVYEEPVTKQMFIPTEKM